jgi:hypothetical protein
VAPVHAIGIAVSWNVGLCDPEQANELRFDAGLLPRFSYACVLDRLSIVDPATGGDRRELRLVGGVVDEKLFDSGGGMLPSDVDDDVWSDDQLPARIFALWARFAAW